MLPGPIFRVELVTAARRSRYFWLRVLYAAIILFVLWVTYENSVQWRRFSSGAAMPSIRAVAEAAAVFFMAFSWVQLIGLLAVAPAMAVGTIATERERRTIEYLFASDLSNAEIVLGKTLARLLLIGKLVLVGLPILFIFRLLGGIPAEMLAASFLISGSTAVFLTALGVCISVWSKRARDATVRVYLVLMVVLFLPLLFTVFGFILGRLGAWQASIGTIISQLTRINPIWTLLTAMSSPNAVGANLDFVPIFEMVAWHAGLSVALIGLATAAVRRVHLRETTRGTKSTDDRQESARRTKPLLPTLLGRRPIGNHPMIWKEMFAGTSRASLGLIGVIAAAIIAATSIGITLYAFHYALTSGRFARDYPEFLMGFNAVATPAALLLIAARASGLVTHEKERDEWLSLLATPLTGTEIILGKVIGNLYAARWPLVLLAFAWVLGISFHPAFAVVFAILTATFLLCAAFVTTLGVMYSLRSKTSMRAMGLTLVTAIFIGGGYLLCCCPVIAVGGGLNGPDEGWLVGLAPCVPFLHMFPPVAYSEWASLNSVVMGSEFAQFLVAYGIGVIGYLIATAMLYATMVMEFDRITGRTNERPDSLLNDFRDPTGPRRTGAAKQPKLEEI